MTADAALLDDLPFTQDPDGSLLPVAQPYRRVLLVDDQAHHLRALALIFAEHGLELHTVPTGEAALRLIGREPPYLAIITDLRLPGISGQELARRLRQPRLIALSGDIRALVSLQHFDARLRKPCPPEQLLAAVLGGLGPAGHA